MIFLLNYLENRGYPIIHPVRLIWTDLIIKACEEMPAGNDKLITKIGPLNVSFNMEIPYQSL
jgi:hypothetical protein